MKPMVYSTDVVTRFADLDPYGHVNSAHYLDYVNTSRFLYIQDELGLSYADLVKRGIGFFMVHNATTFRKSISGLQRITVRSYVSHLGETSLQVKYEIVSKDGAKIFATGEMQLVIMDLAAMRPCTLPEWMLPYLFEGQPVAEVRAVGQ